MGPATDALSPHVILEESGPQALGLRAAPVEGVPASSGDCKWADICNNLLGHYVDMWDLAMEEPFLQVSAIL